MRSQRGSDLRYSLDLPGRTLECRRFIQIGYWRRVALSFRQPLRRRRRLHTAALTARGLVSNGLKRTSHLKQAASTPEPGNTPSRARLARTGG